MRANVKGNWAAARDLKLKTTAGRRRQLTDLLGDLSMDELTADVIERCFVSPNVCDSNGEHANVVDVLDRLASRVGSVARAIIPSEAVAVQDATGGHVASLTEAVMGLTAGMVQIADAIEGLADAVRERVS